MNIKNEQKHPFPVKFSYLLLILMLKYFFSEFERKKSSFDPFISHCWLLLKFFLTNILLLTADIVTDTQTALSFFEAGDYYWALVTLLFIFAPFGVVLAFFITSRCIATIKRYEINGEKENLANIIWQFPLLHPIK